MEGFNINGKILIGIDHGYGNMKPVTQYSRVALSVMYQSRQSHLMCWSMMVSIM